MKKINLQLGLNIKLYEKINQFCTKFQIDEETKSCIMFLTNELNRHQFDNPNGKYIVSLADLNKLFGTENLMKIYIFCVQTIFDSTEFLKNNEVYFVMNIKNDCYSSDTVLFKIEISETLLKNYIPTLFRVFEPTI